MNKIKTLIGVAIVECLLLISTIHHVSHAQGSVLDFSINNNTPNQIDNVFVRPSDSGAQWSDDLLGQNDVVSSGDTEQFRITNAYGCEHDIEFYFHGDNNTPHEFDNINLCTIGTMKVWYNTEESAYEEASQ